MPRFTAHPVRPSRPDGGWHVIDRVTGRRHGESYGCREAAERAAARLELEAVAVPVAERLAAWLRGEGTRHGRGT